MGLGMQSPERVEYAQAAFIFWLELSEQNGLPSHQVGLRLCSHPNPSPSSNKPVCMGASPKCHSEWQACLTKIRLRVGVHLTKQRLRGLQLVIFHIQHSPMLYFRSYFTQIWVYLYHSFVVHSNFISVSRYAFLEIFHIHGL